MHRTTLRHLPDLLAAQHRPRQVMRILLGAHAGKSDGGPNSQSFRLQARVRCSTCGKAFSTNAGTCAICSLHPGQCRCTWNDDQNGVWNKHATNLDKWVKSQHTPIGGTDAIDAAQQPTTHGGPRTLQQDQQETPGPSRAATRPKHIHIDIYNFAIDYHDRQQNNWIIVDPEQLTVTAQWTGGHLDCFRRCKGGHVVFAVVFEEGYSQVDN